MDKMKEIVKSVAPVIVSKLKKLVGNRLKAIHSDATQCNHRIKDIATIVSLISDAGMQKQRGSGSQQNLSDHDSYKRNMNAQDSDDYFRGDSEDLAPRKRKSNDYAK